VKASPINEPDTDPVRPVTDQRPEYAALPDGALSLPPLGLSSANLFPPQVAFAIISRHLGPIHLRSPPISDGPAMTLLNTGRFFFFFPAPFPPSGKRRLSLPLVLST